VQTQRPYELIDVGGAARLERFGERLVDRPHPAALGSRGDPGPWLGADLRFDRDRGWTGPAALDGAWPIDLEGLTLELRPTDAGQVGLFPEHLAMVPWLQAQVAGRAAAARASGRSGPTTLNLFAYTGLATLVMTVAGGMTTHVDSARPAVAWARRNAELSELAARPIRWIVDDALGFALREARRGRRYAGIVLDPPSYGHGSGGRAWRLQDDLGTLIAAVVSLLEPDGFILLTAHTPGFDGDRLADGLARAMSRPIATVGRGDLALTTSDDRVLELGAFARWPSGA